MLYRYQRGNIMDSEMEYKAIKHKTNGKTTRST